LKVVVFVGEMRGWEVRLRTSQAVTWGRRLTQPRPFPSGKNAFHQKGEKDSILFNHQITISNIPAEAYEYTVNGKSAIEWVMERYQVSVDKDSGIRNDANDWAGGRYVLELVLLRVMIGLSVETVKIVGTLPELKFE
jgi:predicted helicase